MVGGRSRIHLDIVAPPNSDFVEGWPGIVELPQAGHPGAAATGTVVVTSLTNKLVEAQELRISLIKTETPFGPPSSSKHKQVVSQQQLWVRQNGALPEMEVGFRLPIPEDLPPSLQLGDKLNTGIFYELVAELDMPPRRTLCIRSTASATLRKDSPLIIEKADLLPTWPLYTASGLSEERSSDSGGRTFQLIARRPTTAYGVGDVIEVPVHLRGATQFKLNTLTMTLKEVTTIKPITAIMATGVTSAPRPTTQSTKNIFERSFAVHQAIDPDEDHRFELREQIPPSHRRITCAGSQIQVGYHLRITASIEFSSRFHQNKTRDWTLEVDKLPVTIAGWGVKLAKAIMERILNERGGRIPDALQGQPQEPSISADAMVLPPTRRVDHPFRDEDATFLTPEPSRAAVQNTVPSAMDPASTFISDVGPQPRAPPPSLYTDAGRSRLNPAELAYHNARLAEQSNNSHSEGTSSGSQRASHSQHAPARVVAASIPEGDSKMTVANPDDGVPASRPLPQPAPRQAPPACLSGDVKREALPDEKGEYVQAQSSVEHAMRPRPPLPEPYQNAANEKHMHQQEAYGERMGLRHTPNLYQGPQAESAAANAVTQFEIAVAARNDRMRQMFGPEGKKDNSPKVSASAADDEKARLAAKYNSKENGHQGPGHSPATATVSSRGSSVDTDMRHERSLYEAAVSERDRNYFANTDHATPTDKLRNMSRNHVQDQMSNSLPKPLRGSSIHSQGLQSRQVQPQNYGRTSPPLPPGAASVRRAPSTRTTTTLHSTMLPTDENFASLYRDPSVKWGKQRAVSPPVSVASHGSSWHGGGEDSCRSPI